MISTLARRAEAPRADEVTPVREGIGDLAVFAGQHRKICCGHSPQCGTQLSHTDEILAATKEVVEPCPHRRTSSKINRWPRRKLNDERPR